MTDYQDERSSAAPGGVGPAPARVDAARMWAGGAATAVVATLVALVGLLITRGVFDVDPYPAVSVSGISHTVTVCLAAAVAALAATALMHLLLLAVPRPRRYFNWIVGLVTAAAVVLPLLGAGSIGVRTAGAVLSFVLGIAISTLVNSAASSAVLGFSSRSGR